MSSGWYQNGVLACKSGLVSLDNPDNAKHVVACCDICIGIEEPETTVPELVAICFHLIEALDDAAQYKGTFLRDKHGDGDLLIKARAVLAKIRK